MHQGQRRRDLRKGASVLADREAQLLERTRAVEYQEQRLNARMHKLELHEQWLDQLEDCAPLGADQWQPQREWSPRKSA